MSTEIKIEYDEVSRALSKLQSSAFSIDASALKNVNMEGQSVLEISSKIVNLNQSLQEVLTAYKDLLAGNVASTNRSVETMKEVERQISVFGD